MRGAWKTSLVALALVHGGSAGVAGAQEAPPAARPQQVSLAQIDLEKDKDVERGALVDVPAAPAEAPPTPPYKKSLVLESSLGAFAFLGKFGKTAPPAPWLRTQVGYEIFNWLMAFGEGELGFTDTSGTQEAPKTRVFPLLGFGGGARFTVRFTDRFGAYFQSSLGLMKADIRRRALEIIGFKDAEDFGLYVGGRLGVEWYQLDRHFALGVSSGLRNTSNFKRVSGSDTPLALDAAANLRYAF